MPCTFSHPLAVIPIHRLWPGRFNLAALIIGSMSPDFAYYAGRFPMAHFAHSLAGTFVVCLPAGLLMLGIFELLRKPLCFVLPQPHRGALLPLASMRGAISWRSFVVAAVSILFGAWTHTIWDSFTHAGGWAVAHLEILRAPLLQAGATALPASYFLQQLSTFGAGAALACMYWRWLRRQGHAAPPAEGDFSDQLRYLLIGLLAVMALVAGARGALQTASGYEGYLAFRVFVFRSGVYSAAVFVPLLVVSAVILYAVDCRRAVWSGRKNEP